MNTKLNSNISCIQCCNYLKTLKSASFAYHSQSRLHPSPDSLYLCMSELDCITANR